MKIASWNLARGLSDAEKAGKIYEGLDRIDADLIFLPESFDIAGRPIDTDFATRLGYKALATEYEDEEPHPSVRQHIVGLIRVEAHLEVARLNTRNAITASFDIEGKSVSVTGAHFDDRREDIRTGMAGAFLEGRSPNTANALIGDLNSMHGNDLRARALASPFARERAVALKNDRVRSLATRLTDMASGDTMRLLHTGGMKDADSSHGPTMLMGGLAIVQLDHFMHDNALRVDSFQATRLKGSDHMAISGDLKLA
jgi:hypothetical protein